MYDFDKLIDRHGTGSVKYDFAKENGMPEDILPLWVADMDFAAAPEIREALNSRTEHGVFGYTEADDEYFSAIKKWYSTRFSWNIERKWLVKTPGVVFAVAAAVRAFTGKGEGVLIQKPVYYPFERVIKQNERRVVNSPLLETEGRYEMDFDDLEEKIRTENVRLYILCSPHNPVGRVWTEEELNKVGEICLRHGVIVLSDEIHSDFVWGDYKHSVFASLSDKFREISVTCTSPSKTFNLAGLQISNIFIPDESLRRKFRFEVSASGYGNANVMGIEACRAAYEEGERWLEELKGYIWDNYLYLKRFIDENIPGVKVTELQGTYLVWLDFRKTGYTEDERKDIIVNKGKLWLDSGIMFGEEGRGFERINIACPRHTLETALVSLGKALDDDKRKD